MSVSANGSCAASRLYGSTGGAQVALIVPTTLLARQHYLNFKKRLSGFPVKVKMLSRLVTPKEAREIKQELKDGSLEIVIGTHALLAKDIEFCNLGLLIVDEEQHFGVAHKERLKQLKSDVHILTLSATPIPRTLQLSLTGVKQLSIIATPPVDRLAARTFVMPFDKVMIREAIYREKYRGGQIFSYAPVYRIFCKLSRNSGNWFRTLKLLWLTAKCPRPIWKTLCVTLPMARRTFFWQRQSSNRELTCLTSIR